MKQFGRSPSTPHKIPVAVPEPYPTPSVEKANPAYARLLMADLSSGKGEMTTIYSFVYQSWILEPGYEELAGTLLRIAEVEMRHLHILGDLIVQLGGDPKCFSPTLRGNSQGARPGGQNPGAYPAGNHAPSGNSPAGFFPWNGGMVNYTHDVRKILTDNVLLELSAIDSYTAHAQAISDERVSALLLRLAQDETVHKGIFESYLTRLLD